MGFSELEKIREMERKGREMLSTYGYLEVQTPTIESEELFAHTLGDTSDLLTKACSPIYIYIYIYIGDI